MKKLVLMGSLVLLGISLWVVAFPDMIQAGTFTAFGPEDYIRSTKQPVSVKDNFSVLNPDTSYTLHIYNGGKNNQFEGKVSSAVISLNGVEVVRPNEFSQNVFHIQKPINLVTGNALEVELRSKPGSGLTIEIIGVDNDKPTIVATLAPSPNAAGWNNTDVTVNLVCSDTISGIAFCPGPVLVQQDGVGQVITGTATDNAGNTATTSVTVNLDKTSPTIVVSLTPPPNAVGWNNTNTTVHFACSDTTSGIAFCPGDVLVQQEGANQVITGTATDIAGNTGSASVAVSLDKTSPTIATILTPAPNAAGWNNTNATVSFACSDTTSGIASCPGPLQMENEGANQVVSGTATDVAGNTASISVAVNIDRTPPVVTILSPLPGANLQDPSVICSGTANDALSGVASVTCNGIPASLSNSSFTCNVPLVTGENILETVATDLAGNIRHSSITVGFMPPALELAFVDDMRLDWWDKGSGGTWDGNYAHPVPPAGFYSLGSFGQTDYGSTNGFIYVAKELIPGALARPADYTLLYDDRGSGADLDGSFWKPVPPAGYVCLGLVAQRGYSKPSTDAVRCVREDLTVPAKVGNTIWIDHGTGANYWFGSWQIIPANENGIFLGTFTGRGEPNSSAWSPPTGPLFTIDARRVKKYDLSGGEIEELVQLYGPELYFYWRAPGSWWHWREDYFPDDPEFILNGAYLMWGLVQNEWDYDTFDWQYLGHYSVSAWVLMNAVSWVQSISPYSGDPSFRMFIYNEDYRKPGSLDRAKALVRVRPWNWLSTDLQFWFFYPFNGPGRAEVCATGNDCVEQHFDQLGRHYGDWEYVTLRVDNRTKQLTSVYMSRHGGGQWFFRTRFPEFNGTHPKIYVAKYSHAHYPAAGTYDYERVYESHWFEATQSVDLRDLTSGTGAVFSASDKYRIISSAVPGYEVTEPNWLQFQGRWGQYERLKEDITYIFSLYTYKEVGAGPTGPAMKRSWVYGDSGDWWWTRRPEGTEACFDGIDNDGDGEIDCHDPDCWLADPVCILNGWRVCHDPANYSGDVHKFGISSCPCTPFPCP